MTAALIPDPTLAKSIVESTVAERAIVSANPAKMQPAPLTQAERAEVEAAVLNAALEGGMSPSRAADLVDTTILPATVQEKLIGPNNIRPAWEKQRTVPINQPVEKPEQMAESKAPVTKAPIRELA